MFIFRKSHKFELQIIYNSRVLLNTFYIQKENFSNN